MGKYALVRAALGSLGVLTLRVADELFESMAPALATGADGGPVALDPELLAQAEQAVRARLGRGIREVGLGSLGGTNEEDGFSFDAAEAQMYRESRFPGPRGRV